MHFRSNEDCTLNLTIFDSQGSAVRTLAQDQDLQAGIHTFTWDGKDEAVVVEEGAFTLTAQATDAAQNGSESTKMIYVDISAPLITDLATSTPAFSPNSDGALDTVDLSFAVSEASEVKVDLINPHPDVLGEDVLLGNAIPETDRKSVV